MGKFEYKIIIDQLPQRGPGNGVMQPDVLVVHHSAVKSEGPYNIIQRLSNYAQNHMARIGNPGLAYHFYISRIEDDPYIYVTRYLNQVQWHCSNGGFNARSLGILVDGNFEEQNPLPIQLEKLKQLLDDLNDRKVFPDNNDIRNLRPKDNQTVRTERGVTLRGGLAYHNEVAERAFATSCAGKNLVHYVNDYKAHSGNVNWGNTPPPTPPTPAPINMDDYVLKTECEARINFVAGNLRSQIEILEREKNTLQSEIQSQLHYLQDFQNENLRLEVENRALKEEISRLRANPISGIITNPISSVSANWKLKFIEFWNKLPVWVRYLVPNIISLALPTLILLIQNFDFSQLQILSIIGISHTALQSLIIGYLKNLDKKLRAAQTGIMPQ